LQRSRVAPAEIDLINGHLTATAKDPDEVNNWAIALGRRGSDFPYIHSLKGMVGHCISAAGTIESVAAVLGLQQGFVFPSINCEDPHPAILDLIAAKRIIRQVREDLPIRTIIKAGFGFGDVNACVVFRRYDI
ncbi:MAG: beta-ketoacyl-[acyl-carrier-protein] synthase family protein, partial [Bacteroidetes bacterium]